MDPLTALATFNASYAVVKTAAQNAGEISEIFSGIGKMLNAKATLDKASPDSNKSDLELYAAKVEVDQKWDEVKQILVWTGHWDGYQKFVADRREKEKQARLKAVREAQKRRKNMQDIAIIVGGIVATFAVIAAFMWAIAQAKG